MVRNFQYENTFRFKDIDLTFGFHKLPYYDKEYLKTMVVETINDRSVKCTGIPFNKYYTHPENYALFNNKQKMINWMSDFYSEYANTASHLLHGKKYYFAWTYQ
jgi:hypothetical protein